MTITDIYAAEREACRLECLCEEAENTARRVRIEYATAVRRVRELVRAAAEYGKPGQDGQAMEAEAMKPTAEYQTRSMLDLMPDAQADDSPTPAAAPEPAGKTAKKRKASAA